MSYYYFLVPNGIWDCSSESMFSELMSAGKAFIVESITDEYVIGVSTSLVKKGIGCNFEVENLEDLQTIIDHSAYIPVQTFAIQKFRYRLDLANVSGEVRILNMESNKLPISVKFSAMGKSTEDIAEVTEFLKSKSVYFDKDYYRPTLALKEFPESELNLLHKYCNFFDKDAKITKDDLSITADSDSSWSLYIDCSNKWKWGKGLKEVSWSKPSCYFSSLSSVSKLILNIPGNDIDIIDVFNDNTVMFVINDLKVSKKKLRIKKLRRKLTLKYLIGPSDTEVLVDVYFTGDRTTPYGKVNRPKGVMDSETENNFYSLKRWLRGRIGSRKFITLK